MAGRTLAGSLGLTGDWDLGENNWKDDNDLNLLKLSVVVQGRALELVSATPGAPAEGGIYLFSDTHPTQAGKIGVYDEATWKYITPAEGWRMWDVDSDFLREFDGTTWIEVTSGGGGGTVTESIIIAVGDETTAITAGAAKVTFRMPYAFTLTAVRASLNVASSSGTPTVDINEGGASILSTKLTIDSGEKTSTTAAAAAVISDSALADDAEITIDIDTAGTGATGLKVYLIGHQ